MVATRKSDQTGNTDAVFVKEKNRKAAEVSRLPAIKKRKNNLRPVISILTNNFRQRNSTRISGSVKIAVKTKPTSTYAPTISASVNKLVRNAVPNNVFITTAAIQIMITILTVFEFGFIYLLF